MRPEADQGELTRPPGSEAGAQPHRPANCAQGEIDHLPVGWHLDILLYFCEYRNMAMATAKRSAESIAKYADMFSAMGVEPRLRIMQLLLSAHPDGLVVGEIQEELDIPNSTLSHHLDKLRNEGLVQVRRESTFLRYSADTDALQRLLGFLYAECCTRNKALKPEQIMHCCK
jgi:ArsR family transcriptional regulator, arsenate/arsenite/antimonite-responsive transcriptional repressor